MFRYLDLSTGQESKSPELLFPAWSGPQERITVFSPHDDDALLGAGYLLLAMLTEGAALDLIIFCDGRAGYSRPQERESIIARRREETLSAYQHLGIKPSSLHRLDLPDFSLPHYLGWKLPHGAEGLFARLIPLLRRLRPTRLILPNGWREHLDHTAVYLAGLFFGPQVGDAVLADWGQAPAVQSALVYSVWNDFPPSRAGDRGPRADRAIVAPAEVETRVQQGLHQFASQAEIISGLIQNRRGRVNQDQALELYQTIELRPRLDYRLYWERLRPWLK